MNLSWLLSDQTRAIVEWLALLAGLIGLGFTFREARVKRGPHEALLQRCGNRKDD